MNIWQRNYIRGLHTLRAATTRSIFYGMVQLVRPKEVERRLQDLIEVGYKIVKVEKVKGII